MLLRNLKIFDEFIEIVREKRKTDVKTDFFGQNKEIGEKVRKCNPIRQ